MDGFKQRIIGAVIIVCLAVIFLPMMFDEPHQERTRESIDLPEQPDFPEVRVDSPQAPAEDQERNPVSTPETTANTTDSASEAQDSPVRIQPEPESELQSEPEESASSSTVSDQNEPPDSAALEGSYLVQLGSFGNGDNARTLRDRVREEGVKAYVETFQRESDTLIRVFAGPFLSRDKAESVKKSLDQVFGLDTLVISAGDND